MLRRSTLRLPGPVESLTAFLLRLKVVALPQNPTAKLWAPCGGSLGVAALRLNGTKSQGGAPTGVKG